MAEGTAVSYDACDIPPDFAFNSNSTEAKEEEKEEEEEEQEEQQQQEQQDQYDCGHKQSKSILDIFGSHNDEIDAAVIEPVRTANEELHKGGDVHCRLEEYFQYDMRHIKRGIFVIFNHKVFKVKGASKRNGTDCDKKNLTETAERLGFTVYSHDDLTVRDLITVVRRYSEMDYKDSDCFACAVLTHGECGDVMYAYDGKYSMQDLLDPFRKCPTLAGKPKLFFIQACRGTELDDGMSMDATDALMFDGPMQERATIPVEADFFMGYSTVEGYYAWRNQENGSWFIQALCFCLKKYHDELDLMQIMTRVNCMVAYDFESNVRNPDYYKKKQMPSIVTRLTKDVFLRAKDGPQPESTDGFFSKLMPGFITSTNSPTAKKGGKERATSDTDTKADQRHVQEKLLQTRIKLAKASLERANAEAKECEMKTKMYSLELQMLQK